MFMRKGQKKVMIRTYGKKTENSGIPPDMRKVESANTSIGSTARDFNINYCTLAQWHFGLSLTEVKKPAVSWGTEVQFFSHWFSHFLNWLIQKASGSKLLTRFSLAIRRGVYVNIHRDQGTSGIWMKLVFWLCRNQTEWWPDRSLNRQGVRGLSNREQYSTQRHIPLELLSCYSYWHTSEGGTFGFNRQCKTGPVHDNANSGPRVRQLMCYNCNLMSFDECI